MGTTVWVMTRSASSVSRSRTKLSEEGVYHVTSASRGLCQTF